jgi:tetratricopeptide (TPR) repeat protein
VNIIHVRKYIDLTREEIDKMISQKQQNLKDLDEEGKTSHYFKELTELALLQLEIENYEKAKENFETCLDHFKKQKDRLGIASVFGVLGTLHFKKGEYKKAIDYYEKSFEIYDELKQTTEKIMSLKGIGNSYINLGKLNKANDVFLECSSICSDDNDIHNLLDCLGNLVYIHETQGNWDVMFEIYKKILKGFKELQDQRGIITAYFNLGIIMKKKQNYEEALYHFKKGTNLAIDANYSELIIKGLSYVGESLYHIGEIEEAKDQYIKALALAEKVDSKNAILQIETLLASLGLKRKEIKNELKKHRKNNQDIKS